MAIKNDYEDLIAKSQAPVYTRDFDEGKGVAGRVDAFTRQGSPLMQRAATRAAQAANRMGLRNSSMAITAGQNAVFDAAMPIANADAQLYQQQELANQTARNNNAQFNATARSTLGSEGIRLGEGARQFDAGMGLEREKLTQNESQFARNFGEQGRQFDVGTALERQKLGQNESQFSRNLGEQGRQFDAGSALERERMLQGESQFARNLGEQGRQFDTSEANRSALSREQMAEGARQFGQSLGFEQSKLDKSLFEQARQYNEAQALERQKLAQQNEQFGANLASQKMLAEMDASNRMELARVEAGYRSDIAGNENISNAWGTTMQAISQIQNNPDLNSDTKTALIKNQVEGFKSFTNFWKKVSGGAADVSDLLSFGAANSGSQGGGASTPSTPPSSGGYTPVPSSYYPPSDPGYWSGFTPP